MDIRKVLLTSKLMLVVILGCVAVKAFLTRSHSNIVFRPSAAVGTENAGDPQSPAPADLLAADSSVIVSRNIFGAGKASSNGDNPDAGEAAASEVPSAEEELGLTLIGVVSGSPAVSRAIIRDNNANVVDRYRIDQMVAGARIERIDEDAVILFHNGREKRLSLKTAGAGEVNASALLSSQATAGRNQAARATSPADESPAEIPAGLGYIESILRQAVIEPCTVEGRPEGLRLTGLDRIPAARALGLRDGDVIRAVNGHTVANQQKAFQVLMKARSQRRISVELSRGGETRRLSFDIR